MKNILFIISFFFFAKITNAQTINWASLKSKQKHLLNINTGWEYGFVYGMGYGYKLKTKLPIIIDGEYSFPSGKNIVDDFKTKVGGKIRLYQINNFQLSANVYGVFRRFENPLVRLANFGSDLSGVIGYYKSKWFLAWEIGFDKAIVSHFKHSELFKTTIYSNVKDGWFEPSTGGNFYYGIQSGISFKQHDIYLKAGRMITQDFRTTPLIPFYAQLGYNLKLKTK